MHICVALAVLLLTPQPPVSTHTTTHYTRDYKRNYTHNYTHTQLHTPHTTTHLGGQLAVQQEVRRVHEVALVGELLDRHAPVEQLAGGAVDVRDRRLARGCSLVVCLLCVVLLCVCCCCWLLLVVFVVVGGAGTGGRVQEGVLCLCVCTVFCAPRSSVFIPSPLLSGSLLHYSPVLEKPGSNVQMPVLLLLALRGGERPL